MADMPPIEKKSKPGEKERNTATLSKISNAIKCSEKLDVEGTDLLELLSHLEGELQARDVVIAALKSEQLKKVLYGCYVVGAGPATPDSAFSGLQRDKHFACDATKVEEVVHASSCAAEHQIAALQAVIEKQRAAAAKLTHCLRRSEEQRSQLVQELEEERHKHEHDTEQGDDITYELEKERTRLKQDLELSIAEKQKADAALADSLAALEEEKSKQKQIVLVLLSDRKRLHRVYLEEKRRSEDLAQVLHDEKGKMETMAVGLEEESKRSLAMEAELEKHLSQFGCERQQLRDKLVADERRYRDLEDALRKARLDVEHFKKQLAEAHRVAMSQASPPPPYPGNNLVGQSVSPTPMSAMNRPAAAVAQAAYATYSSYATYGQIGPVNSTPVNSVAGNSLGGYPGVLGGTVPRTTVANTVNTSRATQGNPVVRSLSGNLTNQPPGPGVQANQQIIPNQQSHKFHQPVFTSSSGGFGHTSHPAMIPTGGTLSHLDQDIIPSDIYSQISKPNSSGVGKPGGSGPPRKPTAESSAASANRKPGLGKGVPPPVPPNKPAVPVKKEIGKRMDGGSGGKDLGLSIDGAKQSMVTGLQGLKFGISIGGGGGGGDGKIKPISGEPLPIPGIPAKKFFSNIESKT